MQGKTRPTNIARLWRPIPDLDLSLFKARFTTFAYDRHTHDEFAIGVIERGAQCFHHKGTVHKSPTGSIITVNPDEVHDGMAASKEGYSYRMLYVGLPFLEESFGDLFHGAGLRAFSSPVTQDPELACRLSFCLARLDQDARLLDHLLLPILYDLFARHAAPGLPSLSPLAHDAAMSRALEYIRCHSDLNIGLGDLAQMAGLSKYHFLRVFKQHTGLTPHAYLLKLRVEQARKYLEQGMSPSDVASMAGFSDQSHLTRRFKAVYGVTPGVFQSLLPSSTAISF